MVVESRRGSSWPSTPAPGPVEAAVALVLAQALPARPVGWVRGLLPRVRMAARHAGPPTSVVAAVVEAGVCIGSVHPAGALRAAEVLGAACTAQLLDGEAGPGGPGGSGWFGARSWWHRTGGPCSSGRRWARWSLSYLVGPGRSNEHTEPHLVAGDETVLTWHDDAELDRAGALEVARHLDRPRAT